MSKKKKESELKSRRTFDGDSESFEKIEILSKLREMQAEAQKFSLEENFDDAIILSDKIMRIAVKYGLSTIINEQKLFIKEISKEVEKDYFKPKIKEFARWILTQYDKLAQSDGIYQAHNLVKSLVESYGELPGFNSIPEVEKVLKRDEQEWLKFNIRRQNM